MKQLLMIAFILLPMFGFATSQRATSSAEAQLSTEYKPRSVYGNNFVGLELLGRGVAYSLNYERAIKSNIAVGAGLSYYNFSLLYSEFDVLLMPLYGTYYLGGPKHRAFFTGGATLIYIKSQFPDTYNWNEKDFESDLKYSYAKQEGFGVSPHAGIGYEFRTQAGFTARFTSYVQYTTEAYRWLGLTLGTHF